MSKATGIKGYTPDRLRRSKAAIIRQDARDARTNDEQIEILRERPGASVREGTRLTVGA